MVKQKVAERDTQKACTDLLTTEGVWWMRLNVGAVKIGERFIRFAQSGTADVLCTPFISERPHPIILWIELKSSTGRQSQKQKEFQETVELAGHTYLLVNNVDILRDWLKAHGCIR